MKLLHLVGWIIGITEISFQIFMVAVAPMISLLGSQTVLDSKPVPNFLWNIGRNLNSYTRTQSCFNKGTRMRTSCNAVNIKTTNSSISDVYSLYSWCNPTFYCLNNTHTSNGPTQYITSAIPNRKSRTLNPGTYKILHPIQEPGILSFWERRTSFINGSSAPPVRKLILPLLPFVNLKFVHAKGHR